MSSENGVLRTSLLLLWPVWTLALLAGSVYEEYSHWFGATLVVPLVYSAYRASKRLWEAKEVSVKPVEVVLLNLAVPLIAVLGSQHDSPTVNLLLISSAVMHFQLLGLMSDKITRLCMSLLVAISGVLTFLVFAFTRGPPLVIPASTALVYLLLLVWFWILRVPHKLPLRAFCITLVLLSTAIIIGVCVLDSTTKLDLDGLFIFGCVTIVIVAFLCVWEYLVCRYPGKELVVNSSMFGAVHLICMLLGAAYSLYDPSGSYYRGSEDYICDILCAYWFIVLYAVARYLWHRRSVMSEDVNDQEEPLPTEAQKNRKMQVIAVAALEALLLTCNYVAATKGCDPLTESVLMLLSGLILLALTNRLDKLRILLAPHNCKLLFTAIVLAIYAFSTGLYLAHYGTLGNRRSDWRDWEIEKTEIMCRNTLIRILWISSGFFVNLAVHFAFAIANQKKKAWMRLPTVAKVAVLPFKPATDKSHHGMGI